MTCYFCNLNKDINIENKKQYNFDISKNYLIKADNLDVLYAMQNTYKNKVKLIYIDPPYNTKTKRNYKDKFTHQEYLDFMYPRLALARELLSDDGVIFVQIDDNEQAYLKVLMDEIFGRDNFVSQITRKTGTSTGQDKKNKLTQSLDYIICYSKSNCFLPFNINMNSKDIKRFNLNDEKGKYYLLQLRKTGSNDRKEDRPNLFYPITSPDGKVILPFSDKGYESCWRVEKKTYTNLLLQNKIIWKKDKPYEQIYLNADKSKKCNNLWDDIVGNKGASLDLKKKFADRKVFSNPKPEELLQRIIQIGSNEGDIVLDFFAGSGTTPAVAHKMNRRWIAVEQMDYIEDITKERLKKVINGEQGGISKDVSWQGGGEFIYFDFNLL